MVNIKDGPAPAPAPVLLGDLNGAFGAELVVRWADHDATEAMNTDATKQQRRKLRELAAMAHERELARELGTLEAEFRRWRAHEVDAHELSDRIHRFHEGPAKLLHSRYDGPDFDMAVARAILQNVISEEEAGSDIVRLLSRIIESARSQ